MFKIELQQQFSWHWKCDAAHFSSVCSSRGETQYGPWVIAFSNITWTCYRSRLACQTCFTRSWTKKSACLNTITILPMSQCWPKCHLYLERSHYMLQSRTLDDEGTASTGLVESAFCCLSTHCKSDNLIFRDTCYTMSSELIFSKSRVIISKMHAALSPDDINKPACLNDWRDP